VRLAHPSIWPLVASGALTLNFVATLFDLYWLLLLSTAGTAAAVVAWLWPSREERERRLAGEGTTLHGLPVYASGTSAPGWWTMAHIVVVILVASACLVFSYFYLRASSPAWPPAGYSRPDLLLPGLATLAAVACAAAAHWAERGVRRGRQLRLKVGLAATLALVVAVVALLGLDWVRSGISLSAHAYRSLVLALVGFQGTLLVCGLVLVAVVLAQALLGYFDAHRFLAVQNTALYCDALAVNWLVTLAVVYLSPYL
jgi:cytochrome c oxidase subunit I+III